MQLSKRHRAVSNRISAAHRIAAAIEAFEPRLLMTTNSWKSAVSGDWDTASAWSLGHVPLATETASITVAGTYTVTLDTADHEVSSLVVGGASGTETLNISGHALKIDTASSIGAHGVVDILNGSLTGAGTLTNSGTLLFVDATVSAPVVNSGAASIEGGNGANPSTTFSDLFTNSAGKTFTIEGGGVHGVWSADVAFTAGFNNSGTILFTSDTTDTGFDGDNLIISGGVLNNTATGLISIVAGMGGVRTITGNIANAGTLSVATAGLTISPSGTNLTFTNTGTIAVTTGQSLVVNGGETFVPSTGKITGILTLNSVILGSGTLTGGTVILAQSSEPATAALTNAGTLIVEGANGGNPNNTFSGTFINAKGATFEIDGGGAFNVWNSDVAFVNGLTNNGTILFTSDSTNTGYDGANLEITGGVLNNAVGGVINVVVGTGGTRSIVGTINNAGTLNVTGGGLTISPSGTNITFTNTGTITVAAKQSLLINGGETFVPSTGKISGIMTLNAAILGAGTLTGGTIILAQSSEPATAALINAGTLIVEGANGGNPNNTFSGMFTNAKGATFEIDGGGAFGVWNSDVSFANGLVNSGTVLFTSDSTNVGFDGANLEIAGGTFNNAAGATVKVVAGTGGSRSISGTFVNNGTVSVTGGSLTIQPLGTVGNTFTNNGSISVSTGISVVMSGEVFVPSTGTISGTMTMTNSTFGSGTIKGGTIILDNSNQPAKTTLVNAGTIIAEGATGSNPNTTFAGTFTNAAGGTLEVEGGGNFGVWNSDLTIATGFTNSGTILFTSNTTNVGFDGAVLTIASGTLTNAPGGVIEAVAGMGGARAINAPIVNQGLIEVVATDISLNGAVTDSGNIQVLAGTLTVNGKLTESATATTIFGIGGTVADTTFGVLSVPTSAVLAGTLGSTLLGTFAPTAGQSFAVIKYGSKSGSFAATEFQDGNGVTFTSSVGGTSTTLSTKLGQTSFATLKTGTLTITGTAAADVITVDTLGGVLKAVLNGAPELFSTAGITTAIINTLAGSDKATIGPEVQTPFMITAGNGNDSLTAGGGPETLIAGSGTDVLTAGGGADSLVGGSGADTFTTGTGNDTFTGGTGADRFVFTASPLSHTIKLVQASKTAINTLDFRAVTTNLTVNLTSDTALASSTNLKVITGATGQAAFFEDVFLGSGADSVTGNAGKDSLVAGSGTDVLTAGTGSATLIGGSGNDTFAFANTTLTSTVTITQSTGTGVDTLDTSKVTTNTTANLGSNTLITYGTRTVKTSVAGAFTHFHTFIAGSGTNSITANTSGDLLKGTTGKDKFFAKNNVKDTVVAGTGADSIGSSDAIDVLTGF